MRLLDYLQIWQDRGLVSCPPKLPPYPALLVPAGVSLASAPGAFPDSCAPAPLRFMREDNLKRPRFRAGFYLCIFFFFMALIMLSLILPAVAMAWGPGVHMITGNWVLQNLSTLPPGISEALMGYPGQYLHGSLAADIFIGKGSKAQKGHSHNWKSGLELLSKADNLRRKAYALGYLSHLAADTVAHNVYVPGTFNSAPGSGRLAHVYIEWHADANLKWDSLDARGVFHEAGSLSSERILRDTIRQTAWKFWLKKHIYERSISLGGSRGMRRYLAMMDRLFPGQERLHMLDYMLTLSTRGIVSVLKDTDKSPVLGLDPIGADALSLAGIRWSGRGLIIGSIKSIMRKPSSALPGMDISVPVPGNQNVNIIVPELMRDFPPVCTPESFFGTESEQ